ncbi:MAG: hypothetical protein J0H49_25200 [Acidobacteria bacterium]|nr:hypothetical protein [Acidobacteriota bacterium]
MRQKFQCPDIHVLDQFVARRLDASAEESFQRHLAVCGLCEELVERLRDFDREATSLSPEPDWTAMEARLEQACRGRSTATAKPNLAPVRWWQRSPLIPVFGYTLAAALVYPAWLGWTRKAPQPPAPAPVPQARAFVGAAARVLDFNTVRGDQSPAALEARPGVNTAALLFFLPVGPQARLTAEIVDGSGAVAASIGEISSYDRNGNFCVVVAMDGWAPGQYRLVVHPQPGTGQAGLPRTFPFIVR